MSSMTMSEAQHAHLEERRPLLPNGEEIENMPVYPIIHMIRQDMLHFIDTPLTYEAMTAPDLTYTLIRPLEEKYIAIQRRGNYSVVFCLLLNRVHFQRDQNLITSPLSKSRATLCEILAIRTLREYGDSTLELAFVTTTSWRVYSGADEDMLKRSMEELDIDDVEEHVGNAIEMAIIGRAKRFIKSSACQKVIDSIWSGRCVYQAQSSHSILSDTYKRTPIHYYDPHKAPLLDHYRLKVPAVRSVLEFCNFLLFFVLFILALEFNELNQLNWAEIAFMVYALGFSLEKLAAIQEHGVKVYFTGTWNGFDLAVITIYIAYASLRIYGVRYDDAWAKGSGIDCLALVACIIFPRLAFVMMKDTLMILSLRAMISQFVFLMFVAVFCFAGFLYALWTLARNEMNYPAGDIFWWMADLWFGLDAAGFQLSGTFHPYFGPLLMITYTCLSNTLLLTVLVSILSHTFTIISEDAEAEAMFRRAVSTIEGVKADSLFSYQPPVNVFALCIMLPASYVLNPRWFHKVNVFMIRATNLPILLAVAYYERQSKQTHTSSFTETVAATAERVIDTLPKPLKRISFFEGFFAGKGSDIDTIFELEEEIMNINMSALDMRDLETSSSKNVLGLQNQRRVSHATSHHSGYDAQSQHSRTRQPSESGAAKAQASTSPPPHSDESIRGRLTSMVHKGTEMASAFTSPLAQLYQPLVVDDDIVDEQIQSTPPKSQGIIAPGVRRRLSSMHRFPPMPSVEQHASPIASRSRPFVPQGRRVSETLSAFGEFEEGEGEVHVQSPEETAEQVIEGEEDAIPLQVQLNERLLKIEDRQKRIEDLLVQLVNGLKSE